MGSSGRNCWVGASAGCDGSRSVSGTQRKEEGDTEEQEEAAETKEVLPEGENPATIGASAGRREALRKAAEDSLQTARGLWPALCANAEAARGSTARQIAH